MKVNLRLNVKFHKTDKVNVRVILPLYSKIPEKYRNGFRLIAERTVELSWRKEYCGVYEYEFNGITYYFIDNKQYFDRENLFGYTDDVERFSFFSKAVLDILPIVNFFPDIIHTNDWQSSMVCTFLKILEWQNSKYEHIKTLLNIHNLNYQGLAEFNIVKDLLNVDDKFLYLFDYFGKANIMKASIMCADRIVAVSETYKDEIYISLMNQYTPGEDAAARFRMFPELQRKVTKREYDRWIDYVLELGIENAFIQEGETALESFIPAFDLEGV